MLKQFVSSVNPIYKALSGTKSEMLNNIREVCAQPDFWSPTNAHEKLCAPENMSPIEDLINRIINEDTTYAKQPLELRNQRTYAMKSGVNGLLDVARTMYKEATEDVYQHFTELGRKLAPEMFYRINRADYT